MKFNENDSLLRLPKVMQRTGLSRSTIYLRMDAGEFPKSIQIGSRSVAWLSREIDDWITKQVLNSRTD